MRILFLDQSGKLGGAELCLADIAQFFKATCRVGVFAEGTFPDHLRQLEIPVTILTDDPPQVQKASGIWAGLKSLNQLLPLIAEVARLSRSFDVLYANTQKALVVGALASALSRRPFVFHLHDIVSPEHFSATNRRLIIALANRAALVIANSQASRDAFIQAGGRADRVQVVYNGFDAAVYGGLAEGDRSHAQAPAEMAGAMGVSPFIVGHFSRLSPWKGQHVLIEALQYCPANVVAVLVGDALFGEQAYVQQLHQQIERLKLQGRVKFLGFRSDIPQLMASCDLVAHTSTAPEPFGRVIVEAMLSGTPVVAAAAGGAIELVEPGETGWLTPPGDARTLAAAITLCEGDRQQMDAIAQRAQAISSQRFNLAAVNHQIEKLLRMHVITER